MKTNAAIAAQVSTGLSYLAPLGGVCGSVLGAGAVLAADGIVSAGRRQSPSGCKFLLFEKASSQGQD